MRNTLHILFAVVLAVMMCVTGFALTLDTAESAAEPTVIPADTAALAATYVPGLNVITGTADVVTFDEENAADYFATFSADNYDSKKIADLPDVLDPDGTGGNAAMFYHAAFETVSDQIWHTINQSTAIGDGTRKYLIRYDMSYVAGDGTATEGALLTNKWAALQNIYASSSSPHASVSTSVNAWYKLNLSVTPKNDYRFSFRHRVGTSTGKTADTGACSVDLYTYLDNIGFYPYYIAKYMVDGEELSNEQFLLDGDGNIMTVYVPKNDNYPANTVDENGNNVECIGWSIYEGATEPMAAVTLANADITLYPVWAQIGIIDSDVDWIKGAKDAESQVYATATVSATEGYTIDEWTVDVGNTKAAYEILDGSVVITAAGYPGVVSVTAKSGDITATKKIRIVGRDAGNFIPGVDIISGTDEGWTFDNTAEENALIGYFSREGNTVSKFATEANGNKYVNLGWQSSIAENGGTGQCYPQFVIYGYPGAAAIGDRPLQVKMDYMGSRGNLWILSIDPATTDGKTTNVNLNASMGNASAWTTGRYKLVAKATGNQLVFQAGLTEAQGTYKLDNISVTPYYKVTYYNFNAEVVAEEWVLPENGVLVPDLTKVEGATGYALEFNGNAVPAITLGTEDISLYAVSEDVVSFVSGGEFTKVDATEGTYTIPTAEELDIDAENFRLWKDNEGNYYYAGDVVEDVTTLSGKTLTALCFTAPLADPAKGTLIYFFDYEGVTGKDNYTYLDKSYATGTASRWDGNSLGTRIVDTDGNAVCNVISTSGTQLFGYGINYNEKTVGGKSTIEYDFKYITSAANYAKGTRFMRVLNTNASVTGDTYYNVGISIPSGVVEGSWYHAITTKVDTDNKGMKGGIVQFTGVGAGAQQYFDNYTFYIYPAKTFAVLEAEGSDNFEFVTIEGDTYTFEAADGVLAYTDGNGNYFKVGVEYAASDLQFKALYPFAQSVDVPAVIFKYEGNTALGGLVSETNGSSKYTEAIIDEGRDVLHLHAWDKSANSDFRLLFKSGDAAQYDVNEYKHFQFMYKTNNVYKVDSTVTEGYSAQASWITCVYANYNGNGGYYTKAADGSTVLYQFNKSGITDATGNEYILMEHDLSTIATKEGYPIGYGFAIDPINSVDTRFGHDIYIDYVRVYRAGITTVTYDTNAPEGATVLAEVAPDTDRGLGTGYLLKGLRPAVEGYKFMGWALTPDATAADVIESFDLTGDTTVYAVWATDDTYVAPADSDEVSIRGGAENNGIRFKATIKNSEKANLEEFGFIATREVLLPTLENVADTSALTFGFKKNGANTPLYVTGVAYDKDGNIDMINGEETDGAIIYTAVATGIPMDAKKENMVVRTYAKYAFGDKHMVVYGNAMSSSLYDAALAIKNENGEAYTNNKAYIDFILDEEA